MTQQTAYRFEELSDSVKSRVLDRNRPTEFFWANEWKESLEAFCDALGLDIHWEQDSWGNFHWRNNLTNEQFRGRKLREFDKSHMPTGYCADHNLWHTLVVEWERTGSMKLAVESALDNFFKAFTDDYEHAFSDEFVIEELSNREVWFDENGDEITPDGE